MAGFGPQTLGGKFDDEDREGEIPGGLFCEALKFRALSASPSSHTAVSRVGYESHDATPGWRLQIDLVSRQAEYGVKRAMPFVLLSYRPSWRG